MCGVRGVTTTPTSGAQYTHLYFLETDIELLEDLSLKETYVIRESVQIKIEEIAEVERVLLLSILTRSEAGAFNY